MEEQNGSSRKPRIATTFVDNVEQVVLDEPRTVARRTALGGEDHQRRIYITTKAGSYLIVLSSQSSEQLSVQQREQTA
jgi:hypothetical protein